MDKLVTPPTDNLYKFSTVFGILMVAASIVFPFNLIQNLNQKVFDHGLITAEYNAAIQDYLLAFYSPEQLDTFLTQGTYPYSEAVTDEQRKEAKEQYAVIMRMLRLHGEQSPVEVERVKLYSEETKKQSMARFGFTEDAFKTWAAKQTDEELMRQAAIRISRAQQIQPKVNHFYTSLFEIWNIRDQASVVINWAKRLGIGSLVWTVASLLSWWGLHQRHEDALLRNKVKASFESKATEPSTNGRPTILVAVPQRAARRY